MRRTFKLHPYTAKLVLLTDRTQAARAASRCDIDEYPTGVSGTCWRSGNTVYVAVHDGDLQTLVHELGHAAIRVMEFVGHPVGSGTDEPFCYLLDHMYGLCAPHITQLTGGLEPCPSPSVPSASPQQP